MVAFFERELVNKHKWISHDEFVESFAIGQMTPGPPIVNTGIAIGYKLRKLWGALGQGSTIHYRHRAGYSVWRPFICI